MIFGKIIGGLIGLMVAGPVGLIVGIAVGHAFDRGLKGTLQFGSPEQIERIKNSFFETTFLLLGHIAKADGRISQHEIDHTEQVIAQMGLGSEQRQRAIDLFHRGAASDFKVEPAVSDFLQTCGPRRQLQHTLLLFLISLALADEQLDEAEHAALEHIATLMGLARAQLEQLLRMARAQGQFQQDSAQGGSSRTSVEQAYAALGVTSDVSDRDLKRAYRKLMSENHPDKLIARGVPEDMIKLATERAQEITAAYERVRKHRAARH